MFEEGIRGGNSMIAHRYAKANNPLMPDYDPSKPKSFISYIDANNLYGWAMSKKLPINSFDRVCKDMFPTGKDIMKFSFDDEFGYMFMVDLKYPKELHDYHYDYPLAVERKKVTPDMLSPFTKKVIGDLKTKGLDVSSVPTEKLVASLEDKKKYVLHGMNLQLYLSLGMKLEKFIKS